MEVLGGYYIRSNSIATEVAYVWNVVTRVFHRGRLKQPLVALQLTCPSLLVFSRCCNSGGSVTSPLPTPHSSVASGGFRR